MRRRRTGNFLETRALIGTNEKPHSATTARISAKSRGGDGGFSNAGPARVNCSFQCVAPMQFAFQIALCENEYPTTCGTGRRAPRTRAAHEDRRRIPFARSRMRNTTPLRRRPPPRRDLPRPLRASTSTRSRSAPASRTSRASPSTWAARRPTPRSAARAWASRPALISRVGDDALGRFLVETIAREGCDVSHVGIDPLAPDRRGRARHQRHGYVSR